MRDYEQLANLAAELRKLKYGYVSFDIRDTKFIVEARSKYGLVRKTCVIYNKSTGSKQINEKVLKQVYNYFKEVILNKGKGHV